MLFEQTSKKGECHEQTWGRVSLQGSSQCTGPEESTCLRRSSGYKETNLVRENEQED